MHCAWISFSEQRPSSFPLSHVFKWITPLASVLYSRKHLAAQREQGVPDVSYQPCQQYHVSLTALQHISHCNWQKSGAFATLQFQCIPSFPWEWGQSQLPVTGNKKWSIIPVHLISSIISDRECSLQVVTTSGCRVTQGVQSSLRLPHNPQRKAA